MAVGTPTTNSGSSATPTVTVPAGVVAGTIVVLACELDSPSLSFTGKWPSGFTQLVDAQGTKDGARYGIAWKRLTGADSGSYTLASLGSSVEYAITAIPLSGRHATTAPTLSTGNIDNTGTSNPYNITITGLTATAGDDVLALAMPDVTASGIGNGFSGWTSPYTQIVGLESTGGWCNLGVAKDENVSAGATGNVSVSFALTSGAAGSGSWLLAVPAAAGGSNATVSAVSAGAVGDVPAPVVTTPDATVTAQVADAVGDVPAPAVTAGVITDLYGFGDSYMAGGNNGDSTSTRFLTVAAAALGATEHNSGSGGARQFLNVGSGITAIGTQVYQAVSPPSSAPYGPPIRCAVIQASINNLNWNAVIADIAGTVMAALKQQLHYLRAGGSYEALGGRWTYGGSYATVLETDGNSGTGVKRAFTNGDTASLAVPSDFPGGKLYVYGPKTSGFGGIETVVVDGSTAGTSNNKDATITEGSQPWVFPTSSLAAGAHTIGLTVSSIATVDNLNGAVFEAGTLPLIIVLNTARAPTYPGGEHTTTDTDVTNSNTALASMLASEFPSDPNIVLVDIDTILGKDSANFGADGIHPNPTGNGLIADAIVDAVNTAFTATDATVSSPTAEGVGGVPTPGVAAGATVAATPAAATGDVPTPAPSASSTVTAPSVAATGDVPSPASAISATVDADADNAVADATGDVPAPTVTGTGDASTTAPPFDGTGDVPAPTVSAGSTVTGPPLDGTGDLVAPTVSGTGSATVMAPPLGGTGDLPVPSLSAGADVAAPPADGIADLPTPSHVGPIVGRERRGETVTGGTITTSLTGGTVATSLTGGTVRMKRNGTVINNTQTGGTPATGVTGGDVVLLEA